MKGIVSIVILSMVLAVACASSCEKQDADNQAPQATQTGNLAKENLVRAMEIVDAAISHYFDTDNGMAMTEYYNPYTGAVSSGTVDVWPYTSAIEASNAIMHALISLRDDGDAELYNANFERYRTLVSRLYSGLQYYKGTFTLTSYTQTRTWSVYGVHRGSSPNSATVTGVENVYDDQQWLIRELVEAYRLTGEQEYLDEAEYLTAYVLDGWDCTIASDGTENGGITWGPGYCTKHSCSNGPFISPLVWLSEIYAGSGETIEYRYIASDKKRVSTVMDKSEYYLMYAKKVYDYQRTNLYKESEGVYWDMMGGSNDIVYEEVDGETYRANTPSTGPTGGLYSYNSGTMLSGAADLFSMTRGESYLSDLVSLTDASFDYFATLGSVVEGYYTYSYDGFNNWFNCVLLRGYVDVFSAYNGSALPIDSFQQNLDYGYDNYLKNGTLPVSLLHGWSSNQSSCSVKGFYQFAFAAEYAYLSKYVSDN